MGTVVAFEKDNPEKPNLQALISLVEPAMERVNSSILAHVESRTEIIPNLAQHLICSGGKRLRPMLTVAVAQMCDYKGDDHIDLATSVEFMHTATLLHDDVVDESDLRRGKSAARKIWGNQASVLVGDYLLGQAFKLMVKTKSLECLDILSNAAVVIAEGEVLQLSVSHDTSTTEDAYLEVIVAKTASLFAAAAEVGGVISNSTPTERAAFASYGRNLGVAFQLTDDVLDYSGKQFVLGKQVGDDFREGKITLPVVLAYRRGLPDERAFWKRTLEEGDQKEDDLQTAIDLVEKHGAIDDTIARARHYGSIARDAMAIFPDTPYKKALIEAVDFCIERVY